jgi:uncharacterized protein with NRDE domain
MTWFVSDSGYELFFNRDERVSRRHADLPSIHQQEGVSYISPTDADAGGTWIAVNHHGVTVCLLNHYQFEQIATYKEWTSRGEIVRQFATTKSLDAVEEQFNTLELEDYRAFRMFIIDRAGNNRLCVWDGHQGRIELDVSSPKSSSSVDAKHVKAVRRGLFLDRGMQTSSNSQEFLDFHSSHSPSKSQESVCMHRSDANTVSFSYVKVAETAVSFRYADGSPCQAELGAPILLPMAEESCREALPHLNQVVRR